MAYNQGFTATGINLKTRKKPIPEPVSQETLWEHGNGMADLQDRALFYFLYLTGCRISEALQVMCSEINLVPRAIGGLRYKVISVDLITLKRQSGLPRRTVLINTVGIDREMFLIIEKLRVLRKKPGDLLFNYGDVKSGRARKKAYWHLKKVICTTRGIAPPDGRMVLMPDFGINPHYLRHCRATHLNATYGYNDRELMLYFGWSSPVPASTYTNRNPIDLLRKFIDIDGGQEIEKR
jgi:integrase